MLLLKKLFAELARLKWGNMNLKEADLLYKELCAELSYHKKQLHEFDALEIEDDEYDALKRRVENLEKNFPQLDKSFSPLHSVGGGILGHLTPAVHKIKMESLHDSFSHEEILEFCERTVRASHGASWVVEPKIDGLSVSVTYVDGKFSIISTRGDGFTGEDVTRNALKIKNLPKKISRNLPFLELRGEVFMPKSEFKKLNDAHANQDGSTLFKNPRNAASGVLRRFDVADYCLEVLFFNVQRWQDEYGNKFESPGMFVGQGFPFATHAESLDYMKGIGLPVVEFDLCENVEKVLKIVDKIGSSRSNFYFQADGAVVKFNPLEGRAVLGSTSGFPRWAEAFKFLPDEKTTKMLEIEFQIGRTGVITPVAIFEPVNFSGTFVHKASLHNEDYISKKGIRIGGGVVVRRSCDIIPEIVRAVKDENYFNFPEFKMPNVCPCCGSRLERKEGESALKCKNSKCEEKVVAKILHFASRDAMNIKILGEERVRAFVSCGLLCEPEDIYRLTEEKISESNIKSFSRVDSNQIKFLNFGHSIYLMKDINKIIKEIKNSKKRPLNKLIYALGIPFIGKEASVLLAKKFGSLKVLAESKIEDILSIDGIGELGAKSVYDFFAEENLNLLKSMNFVMHDGDKKI